MGWTTEAPDLSSLEPETRARLEALTPIEVARGTVLFRPGEAVKGYVVVLEGEVGVHLVGPTGREILLYSVTPGEACVQSTLGLLGGEDYSAEAVAETNSRIVLLPRAAFLALIDSSPAFRRTVFAALAARLQAMMRTLERVAFQPIESRLAAYLLSRADEEGHISATQAELAAAIGSAREVVARKLEAWAKDGVVETRRGEVRLTRPAALRRSLSGGVV